MPKKEVLQRLKERALTRLKKEKIKLTKKPKEAFVKEIESLVSHYEPRLKYQEEEIEELRLQKERIKKLDQEIKEITTKSPSKKQVQLSQIKELIQYTKEKRPLLRFALKDPRIMQLKKKVDIISRQGPRTRQSSRLMWLTRQAKNRAFLGDWYRAQEAFCYIRDAYQTLFKKID